VITGTEETMELAIKEEPTEEIGEESNMTAALLLVDHPER